MKKAIYAGTALFFVIISTTAHAQFSKGNKFVEASLGSIRFSRIFSFDLYPAVGFFIADNLAVGGEVDIYFGSNKNNTYNSSGIKTNESKTNSVNLGVGPFVRYYFAGDNKSKFYGQAGGFFSSDVSYNSESRLYSGSGVYQGVSKTEYNKKPVNISANIRVGWNRMLTETIALNASLGYQFSRSTYTYSYRSIPAIGPETVSPQYKYTGTSNNVLWNLGFTMFLPSGGKHPVKKK